jgi:inner membrane protein
LPAVALHQALGHRGLLHSAAGLALLAVLVALPLGLWLGWQPAAALVLGYASHLALDASTRSGIPLCYPDRTRRFLLPPYLRVTTGSPEEEAVFLTLALLAFALFFAALHGSGNI